MELTLKQKFILDKKQKEVNFLWRNPLVADEVASMGKEWLSDNEITWKLWQREGSDQLGISPEAIWTFLKEKGLWVQVRKAIKFMPLVKNSHDTIARSVMSEDEQVALKAAMWVQEKMNPDYEDKKNPTVSIQNNTITAISINVKEDVEDTAYLLAEFENE